MRYRLGIIGAGNMAEAIVRAGIAPGRGALAVGEIVAFDPSPRRCEVFKAMGVAIASGNEQVVEASRQVMLAVKPQMFAELGGLLSQVKAKQVVISIMAGLSTGQIASAGGGRPLRVVRVMPNTPMMAGQGMAAVALGEHAQAGDDELTMQLFGAGGKAIRIDEVLMDAITAVSGSGPAYVFYLAEAMEKAANELGLAEHARLLVQQTLLGAATLLAESSDSAAELRRKVTSPGGTTEAATMHMDCANMQRTIIEAMRAAARRSKELGG